MHCVCVVTSLYAHAPSDNRLDHALAARPGRPRGRPGSNSISLHTPTACVHNTGCRLRCTAYATRRKYNTPFEYTRKRRAPGEPTPSLWSLRKRGLELLEGFMGRCARKLLSAQRTAGRQTGGGAPIVPTRAESGESCMRMHKAERVPTPLRRLPSGTLPSVLAAQGGAAGL